MSDDTGIEWTHVPGSLTKRPELMREAIASLSARRTTEDPWAAIDYAWGQARDRYGCDFGVPPFRRDIWPLPNLWLGVSVEDRKYGLPRIEQLRQVPATVRFLSVEPLLEDLGVLDLRGIAWVIVGGESGLGARPMQAEWVRSIRDQCAAAGVAFFFKQWGGVMKKLRGRLLDGRTHDAMPEVQHA